MTTTQQYINWITEDKEATTAATLCMSLHSEYKYYQRAKSPDTKIFFPPGIVPGDMLNWGELPSYLDQLAAPYCTLIEKAKKLPALGTKGISYYDLCDQVWKVQDQLPIYNGIGYNNRADELTMSPALAPQHPHSFSKILELALATGIAKTVLEDMPPTLQSVAWEYQKDQSLYPHEKLELVLNHKDLSKQQIVMIGKKLQAMDTLISRTIQYNGVYDKEAAKKWPTYFKSKDLEFDIEEYERAHAIDAAELSHCLKNTYNSIAPLLDECCRKLGIWSISPPDIFDREQDIKEREKRIELGAKSKRDPTLFDKVL